LYPIPLRINIPHPKIIHMETNIRVEDPLLETKAEDKKQKTKSRRQKAEDKKQKTKSRRQKAEDKKRKTKAKHDIKKRSKTQKPYQL
jgi:hypothetical protein